MQTIVESVEAMEREIVLIQNGEMKLDVAAESAKLRKLQVQQHGHLIGAVRIAGRLRATAEITALNETTGKQIARNEQTEEKGIASGDLKTRSEKGSA